MIFTKLKQFAHELITTLNRLRIILISLIILGLLGYALLQVTEAVNPQPTPETVNQVKLEQQAKRVRYDTQTLQQIRELKNVETNIRPSDSSHSDNPFSTD